MSQGIVGMLLRHRNRIAEIVDVLARHGFAGPRVRDEHLRLALVCCHPALDVNAQVALTSPVGAG